MALFGEPSAYQLPLTLKTWGRARHGVLGHGDGGDEEMPRQLETDTFTSVKKLALGMNNSFVVDDDGALFAWGKGEYCKLGHGARTSSSS